MDSVLSQYGLAGLVIASLATVIVYLTRKLDALQKDYNDLQEKRLQDAKDARDKIAVPMERVTELSEKMYELLLVGKRGA